MSDYIPFELQEQIIIWLPVKSLIRYRSVSKAWKSLIDSSGFIADHSRRRNLPENLLVRYEERDTFKIVHISIVDDDTFPQQTFAPFVPLVVEQFSYSGILGSSHGLLCLYGPFFCYYKALLWNPSIRKSVAIFVPGGEIVCPYKIVLGFGVCPVNMEPTLVKIVWREKGKAIELGIVEVDVYTLSTGKWRSLSSNVPRYSIGVRWSQVAIDRFIYWLAFDRASREAEFRSRDLILSFDMANESFEVIDLPSLLIESPTCMITLSKLRESLAVLAQRIYNHEEVCDVWVMDHGARRSFTKLYTINAPYSSVTTALGFTKNGEPIVKTHDPREYGPTTLDFGVYKPTSEHIDALGIYGEDHSVNFYEETLLLLNR